MVSLAPLTDEELITEIAAGQEAALREFHRRHAAAAVRFAWRLLGAHADAEDAVADAFLDLWQCAKSFRQNATARTWFLAIVRNKALQIIRHRHDHLSLDDEEESVSHVESQNWALTSEPFGDASLIDLERCFMSLPSEQREALYLAVAEQLSIAEIAEIQKVPAGTVATRIHHARRKIQLCLQGK